MITIESLVLLGFERIEHANTFIFRKGDYILKPELGKWHICANHDGEIISSLTWIETISELKRDYYESTKENL